MPLWPPYQRKTRYRVIMGGGKGGQWGGGGSWQWGMREQKMDLGLGGRKNEGRGDRRNLKAGSEEVQIGRCAGGLL